jgi:selenocysteine lyase/cysteine desulfurase
MIDKIYKTKEPSFISSKNVDINFNASCHSYLSKQSLEGFMYYHKNFGVCSGRGVGELETGLEDLIDEIRHFTLERMGISSKDYEVVFTKNATEALNMAYSIVASHVEQTCEESWELAIHPLSHKSLIAPCQRAAKEYDVGWRELPIKKDNARNDMCIPSEWYGKYGKQSCDFILGMPYIDNVFGVNHWSHYIYNTLPNAKFQSKPLKKRHIVLDATQALPYIFSSVSKTNTISAPLGSASAIAFSGHKFHCPHLGVLVIRKKYLEKENFFKLPNITVGGGNLDYKNGIFSSLSGFKGLEAGLQDNASILAFGAFLHHISKNKEFYKVEELNKLNKEIKTLTKNIGNSFLETVRVPPAFIDLMPYHNNNIVGVRQTKSFDNEFVQALFGEQKIQTRSGKFCNDYFFAKYPISTFIRLSFDYSFLIEKEKNIKKYSDKLFKIVSALEDMYFSKTDSVI